MNVSLVIIVNIILLALIFYVGFHASRAFSEIYNSTITNRETNWKLVSLSLILVIICGLLYASIMFL